ncbi:hypothetical protein T11_8472 [Trichinella zimbabwensis]|uniref:Uncharacterized protein n=1 Tax=Trichinella zimbabwensis TaxID=268475 RepID=A0A0V1H100_9BILA|nr:hypothetical protein T11_8472 [Trichinella zimbabwensis]
MYGKEIPNTLDNTSASSEQAYQKFLRKKMFHCARMKENYQNSTENLEVLEEGFHLTRHPNI